MYLLADVDTYRCVLITKWNKHTDLSEAGKKKDRGKLLNYLERAKG